MNNSPRGAPALSRDRIITAAINLADAEGLDAVSMRKVADHIGSGTMSLYRHVSGKDALLVGMVDEVTGRYAYPEVADLDWRERMHVLAKHDWRMYLEHPWVLAAVSTATPPYGPEMLKGMEWALAALEPLNLSLKESAGAILTISNYLQGSARVALGGQEWQVGSDPGGAWQEVLNDVDLSAYTRLEKLVRGEHRPYGEDWFESGLDLILDGIAARARRGS